MKAYVASPLRAGTKWEEKVNMLACSLYKKRVASEPGRIGMAVHDILPALLDDSIPEQREVGMKMGEILIDAADVLYCCGKRLSHGMKVESQYALAQHKPVICFSLDMRDSLRISGLQCIFFFDPVLGSSPVDVVLDHIYEQHRTFTNDEIELLTEGGKDMYNMYHGPHKKDIIEWFR